MKVTAAIFYLLKYVFIEEMLVLGTPVLLIYYKVPFSHLSINNLLMVGHSAIPLYFKDDFSQL